MITKEDLLAFSRAEQEQQYGHFYSAYLSHVRTGDAIKARRYDAILRQMQELWGFSAEEVRGLKQACVKRRAVAEKFIDQVAGIAS